MSTRNLGPERQRLPVGERREDMVQAAMRAFARGGYAGTSTDAVAKEAGVSQPYVVRLFGTKLDLFLVVLDRACATIRESFERVLAEKPFNPDSELDWERLGSAYTDLLLDRDLLMVLMHGFAAGRIDEIAAHARAGMGSIYATIVSTGCTAEKARDFVAQGMLLNVMISMRAPEFLGEDSGLEGLTECAFGDALEELA